jgi:polysaccharide deacetylase 2 family uncharacterized protein YibQ
VKSPISRLARLLFAASVFLCLAACLFLSGCDKIKSVPDSIFKSRRSAKVEPAPSEHPSAVSGPRLAIIIDDLGGDMASADAIFSSLHYPLTLSILPNHAHSTEIAEQARQRGYEVMLHLPMQSISNDAAEPQELREGMSSGEVSRSLSEMLRSVPHAAGVNNHQGSLVTSDPLIMGDLMPQLRQRNLFFIDSRTSAATVAYHAAQTAHVRSSFRNVPFLDDVRDVSSVRKQIEQAIRDAKEKGEGITIGHPHPETLYALAELLPQVESRGVHLVYASDLVH